MTNTAPLERFALSTRWNMRRHPTGEETIEEILNAGFKRIELSYDLTIDLVPGVRNMVQSGAVAVTSVHNFCPVPVGSPAGHPELFLLTDPSERRRGSAVLHTSRTIAFAAEMGARYVVVHAGRVDMWRRTHKLVALCEAGRQYDAKYERIKMKLLTRREKGAQPHLDSLSRSIEELLPVLDENNVCLAIENLPAWESMPTELELDALFKRFPSPRLGMWYDTGHGQVRENLGLISQKLWLEKLGPRIAGMHLHDVRGVAMDHLMPPAGSVDFSCFKKLATSDICLVLEPLPDTPVAELRRAAEVLSQAWGLGAGDAAEGANTPRSVPPCES